MPFGFELLKPKGISILSKNYGTGVIQKSA